MSLGIKVPHISQCINCTATFSVEVFKVDSPRWQAQRELAHAQEIAMSLAQRLIKAEMNQSEARGRQRRDAAEKAAQKLNVQHLRVEIAQRSRTTLSQRIERSS